MENQEIMDQFLENRQNYMMDNNSMQQNNMNVASAGCDAVVQQGVDMVSGGGVAGEILGVKYDEHHEEHDVGDDDELKYVKEVQQSEKQQQQQLQTLKNFGLDNDDDEVVGTYEQGNHELAEKEITNNSAFGNGGDGNFVFGGDHHQQQPQQQHHDLFNLGNGNGTNGHHDNDYFVPNAESGFEDKLSAMDSEIDGFKTEGDFSSTSNVTESVEGFVPHVDVNIEKKSEDHVPEMADEEEPSSLATNTTNGTSSLSENVPHQEVVAGANPSQVNNFDEFMENFENKENTDPLTPQRPQELDLEHSQLNPEAKVFIPSFGSNPASPSSPFATGLPNEPQLSDAMETEMFFGQAPSAVPRHLLGEVDRVVAQSPRKGKGDNNMDAVSVPNELEFELEADKRPHELETENPDNDCQQRDEVMTPDQAPQQLPLDDVEIEDKENQNPFDSTDFQTSPFMDHNPRTNVFMDHGPETSVDLDVALELQSSLQSQDDVMKTSMYVASNDAIEDVLNSVQPIPTEIDSVNNSFIEESATESAAIQLAGDKELLQVEEKEHVSHSPSTEEIQMNLQNTLNSSNKDIPQIPNDMDNVNNMQESMYLDHDQQQPALNLEQQSPLDEQHFQEDFEHQLEHKDLPQEEVHEQFQLDKQEEHHDQQSSEDINADLEPIELTEHSILADTTNPLVATDSFLDNSHGATTYEQQQEIHESFSPFKITDEVSNAPNFDQQQANFGDDIATTPSSTTDEKHLLEDTKEQQMFSISGLEQQMSDMMLNSADGHLSQVEEVAATNAATAIEDISDNLISPDEAVQQDYHHQEQPQENVPEHMMVDDSFSRHEQECLEQYQQEQQNKMEPEAVVEPAFEQQHHQELESEMVAVEEPMIEAKQSAPLFSNEQTEIATKNDEDFNEIPEVPETAPSEVMTRFAIPEDAPFECLEKPTQVPEDAPFESLVKPTQVPEDAPYDFLVKPTQVPEDAPYDFLVKPTQVPEDAPFECLVKPTEVPEDAPFECLVKPTEVPEDAPSECLVKPTQVPEDAPFDSLVKPTQVPEDAPSDFLETSMDKPKETETEPIEEVKDHEVKTNLEEIAKPEIIETPETKTEIPVEAIAAAAVAATAAVAAVKTAVSPSKTKTETAKKPLAKTTTTTTAAAAAKPKVGSTPAAKKPVEAAKKPLGLAAKPRVAPAKPAAPTTEKKPLVKTTTTTTTTMTARKPLSATTTTASKLVSKTTTATSTTRTATTAPKTTTTTRPTTAPRTVSSATTTARKPLTTTTTTNGPLAKPRPATAPAKPTTLGLPATNGAAKPKPTSPRSTLTSQIRKTTPATTTAKSPVKPTATNGVAKPSSTTLASKTKTTTSTVSSTAGKTFTARPAPKFTSSSSSTTTTTTTRRLTVGGTTTGSTTTTTTTKISSTPLRKSSPTKPATTAGRTPTKPSTTAAGLKSKASATKTSASPPGKPAPIRKPVDKTNIANGNASVTKELNGSADQITAPPQEISQNEDLLAVQQQQQNGGDSSIPMQTEEQQQQQPQFLLESMDLINA